MFRVPGGKDLHTVIVRKGNMFENTLNHQARSIPEGNLPKVYSLKSRKYHAGFCTFKPACYTTDLQQYCMYM